MKPAPAISAVAGALAFLLVGAELGFDSIALVRLAILGGALGQIVRYDLRERRIPNRIVLPATAACATLSLLDGVRLSSLIGGGVLIALLLAGSLLRPEWLGMGDVKLALLILCGLHGATLRAVLLGIELAVVVVLLLTVRRGRQTLRLALPLAPFLAAGSLLALLI
jgi:leader peptidase (prepilin peptidase) / N-methyltransferase